MTEIFRQNKCRISPNTHIVVVGLGKSGIAAVRFFLNRGCQVSVSDSSPIDSWDQKLICELKEKNVFIEGGKHTSELFCSADIIMVSPGVPLDLPVLKEARTHSIPVVGEMAFTAQFMKTPIVAVTGTNGKTTVTTLLGDIFKASGQNVFVGGNIGTPLFEYMDSPQDKDIAVIEVSSFQLDTAGGEGCFRPKAAVLLNISQDHLDRYESFNAYARSKFSIFAAQKESDFSVINVDDPEITSRIHLLPPSKHLSFGHEKITNAGSSVRGYKVFLSEKVTPSGLQEKYDLEDSSLSELPNSLNAAAAILIARVMGCSEECINKGIKSFSPLPHRLSLVDDIGGVSYYDDSKATNIGATLSALNSIKKPVILIAGGRDKGGDYRQLHKAIKKKVKALVLLGEARGKMIDSFKGLTLIESADTMADAVNSAATLAQQGDVVLLSPACSSFDMFSSYAERGEIFKKAVNDLKKKLAGSQLPAAVWGMSAAKCRIANEATQN